MVLIKGTRLLMAGMLGMSLVLQACQGAGSNDGSSGGGLFSSSDDKNLTPEEREMREEAQVFNETVLGGAATGALLLGGLCLAGALLGGNSDNLARCAVAAGVGAAVGALDGYLVAKRQEAANQKVKAIELITKDVEADNARVAKLNAKTRKVRDQNLERIREAKAKRRANQISEQQFQAERERLAENIDFISETIEKLKERRDLYYEAAQDESAKGNNTKPLQAQIEEFDRKIAELDKMKEALEKANEVKGIS